MTLLRCEDLRKSYGGVSALAGVSLDFPPSGTVAIIGPNGAGKTTLLDAITGFLEPDSGRTFLDGRDISRMDRYRIARSGLSRTFQDLRLARTMSVSDNVMLARPNQRGEHLFAALFRPSWSSQEARNQEITSDILRRMGLDDVADQPAGDLSYGQQKLLTIACCLAADPDVLFLDEPVSGVDPRMREKIAQHLDDLAREGKLVLFIEHDLAVVRAIADRVVVLDHGVLLADGPPGEVLDRPEIIEAYVG